MITNTATIGMAYLPVNLASQEKYFLPMDASAWWKPLPFPGVSKDSSTAMYLSMFEGQKILSPKRLISEGMKVSAAIRATRIPRARAIPMVCTMANEQRARAAKPIMTEIPDVATDSPPHMIASLSATSWETPDLRSFLYLVMMKIE